MTEPSRPPSGFPTSMPPPFAPPHGPPQAHGFTPQPPPPPPVTGPPQFGVQVARPAARWPLSVVAFLFSFLFGAIALYFSSQVGARWQRGDAAGAEKASNMALVWSIIAIVVGVLALIVLAGSGR